MFKEEEEGVKKKTPQRMKFVMKKSPLMRPHNSEVTFQESWIGGQ